MNATVPSYPLKNYLTVDAEVYCTFISKDMIWILVADINSVWFNNGLQSHNTNEQNTSPETLSNITKMIAFGFV